MDVLGYSCPLTPWGRIDVNLPHNNNETYTPAHSGTSTARPPDGPAVEELCVTNERSLGSPISTAVLTRHLHVNSTSIQVQQVYKYMILLQSGKQNSVACVL